MTYEITDREFNALKSKTNELYFNAWTKDITEINRTYKQIQKIINYIEITAKTNKDKTLYKNKENYYFINEIEKKYNVCNKTAIQIINKNNIKWKMYSRKKLYDRKQTDKAFTEYNKNKWKNRKVNK